MQFIPDTSTTILEAAFDCRAFGSRDFQDMWIPPDKIICVPHILNLLPTQGDLQDCVLMCRKRTLNFSLWAFDEK